VLDPARLGKDLRKLLLRNGTDRAILPEDDRARAGRALVKCKYEAHVQQFTSNAGVIREMRNCAA